MRKKKNNTPKLNLIPILDAIFIFIFFLLMSAQFIDIYEVGSDAPVNVTFNKEKNEEEPLNLKLEINKKGITVKTGLNGKTYAKVKTGELNELNKILIELKRKHPKESSALLVPANDYSYQELIKVIDHTKSIVNSKELVGHIDPQSNKRTAGTTLFENIMFSKGM